VTSHSESTAGRAPARRRWWGSELTFGEFRRYAVVSLLWIYLVVTTGAIVRLTGSGLGCDHWPRCGSQPFPERGGHAFIEFGNRVIGAITIAFTLLAWLAARRTNGVPRWVERVALVVFVGTAAQIPLGGLTVILKLHPLLVMAHFLLALAMLGLAVVIVVEARLLERRVVLPAIPRELGMLGALLVGAGLALVTSGAFATAAGPHAGDSSKIHRLGTPVVSVTVHAAVTGVFCCTFLFVLGYLAARRARTPLLFLVASVLLGVLLVQVALGEIQYRTGLPWWLVLVHVSLAAGLWGGTVVLGTLLLRSAADRAPPA
jgi:cytochrome c oxidase assembly protein subunit 15